MDLNELHEKKKFEEVLSRYNHVKKYVEEIKDLLGEPIYLTTLSRELGKLRKYNIIYPAKEPVFVHIYKKDEPHDRGHYKLVREYLQGQFSTDRRLGYPIYERS